MFKPKTRNLVTLKEKDSAGWETVNIKEIEYRYIKRDQAREREKQEYEEEKEEDYCGPGLDNTRLFINRPPVIHQRLITFL